MFNCVQFDGTSNIDNDKPVCKIAQLKKKYVQKNIGPRSPFDLLTSRETKTDYLGTCGYLPIVQRWT
jgi:hypothetical protein